MNKCLKRKAPNKDIREELMPVAWYPKRWWYWCLSENKKKFIEPPIFTDKFIKY